MRLPIVILLLVVSVCAASADILPPVTPLDMYVISNSAPARIASDSNGKLYVTEPYQGLVYIYSNNGQPLKSVSTCLYPIGIAVDSSKRLYVSDSRGKYVGVYTEGGELLYKFGIGDLEFNFPNDIAIYEKQNIRWAFVTDSRANEIRKYSLDGAFIGSFGSGLLRFPTGIAVDEAAEELYVLDHNNIQIRVYDLNGNLLRSVAAGGKLLRPLGIAVDSSYIYVADAYHSVVAVYSKAGGTFLKYVGTYGSDLGQFKTPSDVALDKDSKMFVTNTDNQRIEVLGINNFTGLKIEPGSLSFKVIGDGSAVTQSVNLSSIGTETSWTAATGASWLFVSPGSGATPSAVEVTVNPSGLSAGNYSAEVLFKTPSGTEYLLKVNAEVTYVAPEMRVSPSSLNFEYQRISDTLSSDSIMISSNGPVIKWSASSSAGWLSVSKASGVTPDSLQVSLSADVRRLRHGSYNATVVIDAGGISGSPAVINVRLDVMEAGHIKVKTNLEAAAFTITGPESFHGTGREAVFENAPEGTYSIAFNHVNGYWKPSSRSFKVETGASTEINAVYTGRPASTHLLAGSGSPDSNLLRIISLEDGSVMSLRPFAGPSLVKVAAGDLDGDGIDEIIVSNGRNLIKVYRADGVEIAERSLNRHADRLEIAVADINNNGRAEIIAGYIIPGLKLTNIISLRLEKGRKLIQRLLMITKGTEPFAIASGDSNGDGYSDLIIAQRSFIAAFDIRKRPALMWSNKLNETVRPNISAGDINDDGVDEIILASGPDQNNSPVVRILKGNGTDYGLEINALSDYNYKYGANTAISSPDDYGNSFIAVGAGPGPENQALISLYNSDGEYLETIKAMDSFFGVNVSFGKLTK